MDREAAAWFSQYSPTTAEFSGFWEGSIRSLSG